VCDGIRRTYHDSVSWLFRSTTISALLRMDISVSAPCGCGWDCTKDAPRDAEKASAVWHTCFQCISPLPPGGFKYSERLHIKDCCVAFGLLELSPASPPRMSVHAPPLSALDEVHSLIRQIHAGVLDAPGVSACGWETRSLHGLFVKEHPAGYAILVEECGRLRIDIGSDYPLSGSRRLVVRVGGTQDDVLGRFLPREAYVENTDEHVVCLGPYKAVVSGTNPHTMWRLMVFNFDVSSDPLRLLEPVRVLLGILMGGELPLDFIPTMCYAHPNVAGVSWHTL
jgi:hypothetical protein